MLSLCLRRAAQPGNVRAISVGRGAGHEAMAAVIERHNVTVQPTGAALYRRYRGDRACRRAHSRDGSNRLGKKRIALEAKVLAAGD
jgi:hypothetical protein